MLRNKVLCGGLNNLKLEILIEKNHLNTIWKERSKEYGTHCRAGYIQRDPGILAKRIDEGLNVTTRAIEQSLEDL